jgi:hypothetical protein
VSELREALAMGDEQKIAAELCDVFGWATLMPSNYVYPIIKTIWPNLVKDIGQIITGNLMEPALAEWVIKNQRRRRFASDGASAEELKHIIINYKNI